MKFQPPKVNNKTAKELLLTLLETIART